MAERIGNCKQGDVVGLTDDKGQLTGPFYVIESPIIDRIDFQTGEAPVTEVRVNRLLGNNVIDHRIAVEPNLEVEKLGTLDR